MTAQDKDRVKMMALLVKHSHPMAEAIAIGEALDRCRAFDVRQIAWENAQAGVKVTANTLLAMALSRAITRQLAEEFMLKEQLKQAKQAVTRTGDTRAS